MLSHAKRLLKRVFRPSLALACDNMALQHLQAFQLGYLPWTASSIRPSTLCAVVNEIIVNRRRTVVEFGAGISTLYLAKVLSEYGGTLYSFEHNHKWCEVVSQLLKKHSPGTNVRLLEAPLTTCAHSPWNHNWYDVDIVQKCLSGLSIDGIVVDGPPASSANNAWSRYPAVPVLQEFLASSYFCCLDDVHRRPEQDILRRWNNQLGTSMTIERIAGSYGMLHKGGSFAISIAKLE